MKPREQGTPFVEPLKKVIQLDRGQVGKENKDNFRDKEARASWVIYTKWKTQMHSLVVCHSTSI